MGKKIYIAKAVFTGTETLHGQAIITEDGTIKNIIDESLLTGNDDVTDFGDALIAPAFIDIQLYGAHGRLLAVYPDAETVREIYQYCKNGGAAIACLRWLPIPTM